MRLAGLLRPSRLPTSDRAEEDGCDEASKSMILRFWPAREATVLDDLRIDGSGGGDDGCGILTVVVVVVVVVVEVDGITAIAIGQLKESVLRRPIPHGFERDVSCND